MLHGRAKDMNIRGRYNIYPELHEPVIERIQGVRRCALIGVFDEELADEKVVLVVEPEPGETGNVVLARVRHAVRRGASAIPDVVRLDTLPTVGRSAKVDKQALRERACGWVA